MRAGQLRQRVTLQRKIITRDSFNAEVVEWSTFATVWAKIETIGGSESISIEQGAATLTHKITIRYRSGLVPTMRVVWDDHTFNIEAVLPDNHLHETVLNCSEVFSG